MPATVGTLAITAAASGALTLPSSTGLALAAEVAVSPLPGIGDALTGFQSGVLGTDAAGGGGVSAGGAVAGSADSVAIGRVVSPVAEVSLGEAEVAAAADRTRVNVVLTARKEAAERAARAKRRAAAQAAAAAAKARAAAAARANQTVLPTSNFRLTAGFGAGGGLWANGHTGTDFAAPYGTPVVSVRAGTVLSAGYEGAYGNKVVVRHADGTETWYCHLSSIAVGKGAVVAAGQVIGGVGSTGNSTGNHLHFEVHPGGGDAVNPLTWLRARGVRI